MPVGGPRVRGLLALLALEVGRPVPDARLVDGIWDEDPPADAANALQSLVRRLRLLMPQAVTRQCGGYALTLDPGLTDVHRFTAALALGRRLVAAGQVDAAATSLDSALAEWRGAPMADICGSPILHALATGLAEQRLATIELRAEVYRILGRSEELLRELAAELDAHPLRETLAACLVTALSAADRHTEALQTFDRMDERLRTEWGAVPSAVLVRAATAARAAPRPCGATQRRAIVEAAPSVDEGCAEGQVICSDLPRRATSFLGRDTDVVGLVRVLGLSPLVTLVGTGGVGKTRLATEMLAAHGPEWAGGFVFVDLAGVGRDQPGKPGTAAIGVAVLAALGQSVRSGAFEDDWLDTVCRLLTSRRMLLALDNCEHVVAAVAELTTALVQRLPLLTVLVTSREALGVDGERLFPVRALALPGREATLVEALDRAAVGLFVERATAVRPDFVLSEDNCAQVCALVCELDGLPLAIELAAARLHALPLSEIAARLGDRFSVLTSTARHTIPRHRTLLAAVQWSWELLSEPEAELARRFSVFVGGATLETVTRICGPDIVDVLASLVAKSLIEFDGERYRMVETVRAYATRKLDTICQIPALIASK
ncbi:AfsR/SARP family transcriptional regulator [Nocardia heshunensis]